MRKPDALKTILKLNSCLSNQSKTKIIFLFFFSIFCAIFESISIVSVLPFLSIISKPDTFWKIKFVRTIAERFGMESSSEIILPITLFFILFTIIASFTRLVLIALNDYFGAVIGNELGTRAYRSMIYRPYGLFIQSDSSHIIATITSYTGSSAASIQLFLRLITNSLFVILISIGLFIVDFKISIIALLIFSISYLFIVTFTKKKVNRIAKIILDGKPKLVRFCQEGVGAIRDIIIDQTYEIYINAFNKVNFELRKNEAKRDIIAAFPRYLLEGIGIISIAGFAYFLTISNDKSNIGAISILGTFALGAQRLLPSMQGAYQSWIGLNANTYELNSLIDFIKIPHNNKKLLNINNNRRFKKKISFSNVFFKYKSELPYVLKNLNLNIYAGETVGIVGKTGSGKSTFIDLLMGLLKPTEGTVKVDDVNINSSLSNLKEWHTKISHVPQDIFLINGTIEENIAFGKFKDEIDKKKLILSAKQSMSYEFIQNLDRGFKTIVGERGIRLSGGQKQRIAIARALYRDANIIIFDEATSALDQITEMNVMESIMKSRNDITVLLIAHRLSTVERCDRLILFDKGKISKIGVPSDIIPIVGKLKNN